MGSNSERIVLHSLNVVSTLKGVSPIQNFFLMKPEKTPYEILKANYDSLKDRLDILSELKNLYKQDLDLKEKELYLYKQGTPSFIEHSHIDFEKAKIYVEPDFSELQMLN
ncbi:hypothetical protein EV142_101408 [Flavobacterium circumlabens]|nr:hypothetical protein EV142_101408 [Flavobacterium circumlabens]